MSITLINNGWFPSGIPWAEYITEHIPPPGFDGSWSYDGGNHHTIPIIVNWLDQWQAVMDLLGQNLRVENEDGTVSLERIPPMNHPIFTHLYCTKIEGPRPFGKFVQKVQIGGYAYSQWEFSLIVATFTQPKFAVLSDANLQNNFGAGQEWNRYVEWNYRPDVEVLSRPGSQFLYAEGAAGNPQGTALPRDVAQFLAKADLTPKWYRVPYVGLFSPTTFRPENILAGLGKVNDATFQSNLKGTLLFKGVVIELKESPLKPTMQNGNFAVGQPSLVCDCTFALSYFQPSDLGTYHGHNLFPAAGHDPTWYLATDDGTVGGATLLQYYDFTKLFTLS
jgi:hypothetical protein